MILRTSTISVNLSGATQKALLNVLVCPCLRSRKTMKITKQYRTVDVLIFDNEQQIGCILVSKYEQERAQLLGLIEHADGPTSRLGYYSVKGLRNLKKLVNLMKSEGKFDRTVAELLGDKPTNE